MTTTSYDPATATVNTVIPPEAFDANHWRMAFRDNPDAQAVFEHYDAERAAHVAPIAQALIAHLDATDSARAADYRRLGAAGVSNRPAPKDRDRWGNINESVACGGGIRFVSCEGHGGFLISPVRELLIPAPLREGMEYEEDCDWAIVGAVFPEAAVKMNPRYFCDQEDGTSARDYARREAVEVLGRWRLPAMREVLAEADQTDRTAA